jgi:type II secretion system protein E
MQIDEVNRLDIKLLKRFPRELLKKYRLLPVREEKGYIIFISDTRPPLPVLDELEVYSDSRLKVQHSAGPTFEKLVNEYLEAPLETVEGMLTELKEDVLKEYSNIELDFQTENLEELAREAPIINLVNAIITTALKMGASDIHLEPFEDDLKIRYRIDGLLYEKPAPPRKLFPAIATRIKIMARLNIAERRLPQEGRIRIKVLGRELDIRVSFIPSLYGESIVLRLLDRAAYLLEVNNLGFREEMLKEYLEMVGYPHGIILVTGPTGSGKTTTLYATLEYLNRPEKKIITIEDPVEYQLEGINQLQVKPEIGFTFSRGLRAMLRQDPDIIMVGEIRDLETARIAIQAALTGHLVFATLHTNDAAGAITRLLDMGVEDYLIAATVRGVLAQRLVRVLCPSCREAYLPEKAEIDKQEMSLNEGEEIFRPVGCKECNGIGFKGRTGIYELLPVIPPIEALISRGSKALEIREEAKKLGYNNLFQDGWFKVKEGITTLDEVIRVTKI